MILDVLFYLNTYSNILAVALVMLGAAKPFIIREDPVIRVGAMLACFGLLGQAFRNFEFFMTGVSPVDTELPFWMLKDLGLVVMVVGYAMRGSLADTVKDLRNQKGKK